MATNEYCCILCPTKSFKSKSHLSKHRSIHRNGKITCPCCHKQFNSMDSIPRHFASFHSSVPRTKSFQCDQCSKKYYSKAELTRHVNVMHTVPGTKWFNSDAASRTNYQFHCTLCDDVFKSSPGRDYHVVVAHTLERAFKCAKCPAAFVSSTVLDAHQLTHTDKAAHKCKICSKLYKRRGDLNFHTKTFHSKRRTRDLSCLLCDKTFQTVSECNRHARTHRPEELFSCSFCDRKFTRKYNLERHLRTHLQEKPYFCLEKCCKYSTNDLGGLQKHKRSHDYAFPRTATPKTATCYFCSKCFIDRTSFQAHIRIHTLEKPFPCRLCLRSFKCGAILRRHITNHTK